jgi:hypothetical protein
MTANLRTPTRQEKESLPMKGILMSAIALSMKKMAFAIFCMTLLMLVAAPAWAQVAGSGVCLSAGAPAPCGVTITIKGTPGNLSATIAGGGEGSPYDGQEDQIVGVINQSTAMVGAIILNGSAAGEPIFGFDGDGPACFFPEPRSCPNGDAVDYQGPNNTFIGISPDQKTGKVLFTNALAKSPDGQTVASGGTTWFALEDAPATVVAIGENQSLAANQTAIFKFGPISVTGGNTFQETFTSDDFRLTPQTGGDSLTVTPVPVSKQTFTPTAPFANLQCVPYLDFNPGGANPLGVCVEIELDCSGADNCGFLYTTQLDYGIDTNGLPNNDLSGIGGPALLVQHNKTCPAAFDQTPPNPTQNIFQSYTGSTPGTDPPLTGSGHGGKSCYAAAFDPSENVPPITAGQVVKSFSGLEFPFNNKVNPILVPIPALLSWDQKDSSGNPVTKLHLCKALLADGVTCSTNVQAPWVNLSLTVLTPKTVNPACQSVATASLPSILNSGLLNLGKGEYSFAWNTLTNPKGLAGCQVDVVLQFDNGLTGFGTFQYLN